MTPPSLRPLVDEYLAFRRALGFDLETPGWLLVDFAHFADRAGHQGSVTIDLAVEWALSSRSRDPAQAARRLSAVRQFAHHRAVFDPTTEIPPVGLLGRVPRRKPPHIYSEPEIAALLGQSRLLRPRNVRAFVPRPTYVALFSLLAATGLRLSEACHLTIGDVDLVDGVITVRAGKFRKSRLLPLHLTAVQALGRYADRRSTYPDTRRSSSFFRTDQAPVLRRAAVEKTFSRLRDRLGWTAQGRARRPRIHDLRHTFAVRRLLLWYEQGADLDRKMLALATYLDHAKTSDTYWYVSAVPELMALSSQRFERFARRDQERTS